MEIKALRLKDTLWEHVADYAENCSWSAGKNLANKMRAKNFCIWERVFVALINNKIAGYCTLSKTDCIPNVSYSPYISFVFVGEEFRGNRLSEKLINFSLQYAKELKFEKVYLVSDHINLYEKYGFVKIDEKTAPWDSDTTETIYMCSLSNRK